MDKKNMEEIQDMLSEKIKNATSEPILDTLHNMYVYLVEIHKMPESTFSSLMQNPSILDIVNRVSIDEVIKTLTKDSGGDDVSFSIESKSASDLMDFQITGAVTKEIGIPVSLEKTRKILSALKK